VRRELRTNCPTVLKNRRCAYCGAPLDASTSTKDHVVSRRFVPRGAFYQSWNLILRCCGPCNVKKSDLEDDLAAISMQPDAAGRFPREDEGLVSEAARKAVGSTSRLTREIVAQSNQSDELRFRGGNMTMTLTTFGPPKPADDRVLELSRLQVCGFFFLITYDAEQASGGWWPGRFGLVDWEFRADWGNPVHLEFMRSTASWAPRMIGTFADGFFQIAIRRNPQAALWSWAVEWNENIRAIGFFGDEDAARKTAADFSPLRWIDLGESNGVRHRYRHEISLPKERDTLFEAKDWSANGGKS
jgi:hypothetical protein